MRNTSCRIGMLCLVVTAFGCMRQNQPVKVGDYEISKADAKYRDAVIRQYYPGESRTLGLVQLIKAYTYAQILKNHGHEVTENVLRKEADRIDLHTKAPEVLSRIKAIFGQDHDAYLRVFVLPSYVRHALYYDFFLRDVGIQGPARHEAQQLLELSKKSANKFEIVARNHGLNVGHFSISPKNQFNWHFGNDVIAPTSPAGATLRKSSEDSNAQSNQNHDPVLSELRGLQSGQIYDQLIERPEDWMIVKKTGDRRGQAEFNSMSVPKADFDSWLSTESSKIRIIDRG